MKLILKKNSSLFSASFVHNNIQENDHVELVPKSLNLPSRCASCTFEPRVLGSFNGVLCLSFPPFCILWNPSTRTHHVIPDDGVVENLRKIDGLGYDKVHDENLRKINGLGYDKVHDDYMLVRFVDFGDRIYGTQIWVYSFGFPAWIMVSRVKLFVPSGGFTDVFVNGCLHFKLETEIGMYQIVAFDVSEEESKLIPNKPDYVDTNSTFDIGVLDGCLCMVLKRNREVETFRVLEMKEYGSGDSWVELFRFEMNNGPICMRPITYVGKQNKKKLLLQGGEELFCIDVESHQQVPITGMDCKGVTDACLCTESQRIFHLADDTE